MTSPRLSSTAPAVNSWTIELPDLPQWNANSRGHWSERAELVAVWRAAAGWSALGVNVPRGIQLAEVELLMVPADDRRRDPDNLAGALKPCLDGLVDARVLPDDSARYVRAVTLRIADRNPALRAHRWLLTVRDLTEFEGVDSV